jgi:hypothetical protein
MSDTVDSAIVLSSFFFVFLAMLVLLLLTRASYEGDKRRGLGSIVDLSSLPNGAYFVCGRISNSRSLSIGSWPKQVEPRFLYLLQALDSERHGRGTKCAVSDVEIEASTVFTKGPDSKVAVRVGDRRFDLAALTEKAPKKPAHC